MGDGGWGVGGSLQIVTLHKKSEEEGMFIMLTDNSTSYMNFFPYQVKIISHKLYFALFYYWAKILLSLR